MNCSQLTEFIADYLGGELPAAQLEVFERHLEECSTCRRYLDSYRKTIGLAAAANIAEESPPPIPEDMVKAILAAAKP